MLLLILFAISIRYFISSYFSRYYCDSNFRGRQKETDVPLIRYFGIFMERVNEIMTSPNRYPAVLRNDTRPITALLKMEVRASFASL